MNHGHQTVFIFLSVVVAVFGSWTALDLVRRVHSHVGRARRLWLSAAALAMGASIWSMHFIAMLGFDPGSPVSYDLELTFLSLALAIGATLGAFFAVSVEHAGKRRTVLAGVAMGFGICLMHYVGMAALKTAVSLGNDPLYMVASFVIAAAASTAALFTARFEQSFRRSILAALILGLAIVGMHYTAMAGLKLTHVTGETAPLPGAPPYVLGVSVALGTVAILFLALLASFYDQRLNVMLALDAGNIGYWEFNLRERTMHTSARAREIFGGRADMAMSHPEILSRLARDQMPQRDAIFAKAVEEGTEYDGEYRIVDDDGAERWINVRGRVVHRSKGQPRRMAGIVLDVTDRHKAFAAVADAEQRQRLLINELNHRVKNTLSTVQSIARQTAKNAVSMEAFRESFEARLVALSKTHNVLTNGAWEQADMRDLLEQEFSPYDPTQVERHGEPVRLNARQALALGMVFHELATNAAKYGALSQASGQVRVAWTVTPEPRHLDLRWTEFGGPRVQPPTRRGFGSRLILAIVQSELRGTIAFDYRPEGMVCTIAVPLSDTLGTDLPSPETPAPAA